MPIYEYSCEACGAHIERMQRVSAPPLRVCPKCGGGLHKMMSLSSFQLKGSGWYATDYARKNGGNGNGHGKKPATEEGAAVSNKDAASGEPKAETKSDAKTEAKFPAAASS
jgi:putative FmdB family regulatory protein